MSSSRTSYTPPYSGSMVHPDLTDKAPFCCGPPHYATSVHTGTVFAYGQTASGKTHTMMGGCGSAGQHGKNGGQWSGCVNALQAMLTSVRRGLCRGPSRRSSHS